MCLPAHSDDCIDACIPILTSLPLQLKSSACMLGAFLKDAETPLLLASYTQPACPPRPFMQQSPRKVQKRHALARAAVKPWTPNTFAACKLRRFDPSNSKCNNMARPPAHALRVPKSASLSAALGRKLRQEMPPRSLLAFRLQSMVSLGVESHALHPSSGFHHFCKLYG